MKRLMCRLGLHYWRRVFYRNPSIAYPSGVTMTWESKKYGEFTAYKHRCRWCLQERDL